MQRAIKVGGRLFRQGVCYQADDCIQTIVRVCDKRWGHQRRFGGMEASEGGGFSVGSVIEGGGDWMAGTTVSSQFPASLPVARNHSQHKKAHCAPQSEPAMTHLHGNQHGSPASLSFPPVTCSPQSQIINMSVQLATMQIASLLLQLKTGLDQSDTRKRPHGGQHEQAFPDGWA